MSVRAENALESCESLVVMYSLCEAKLKMLIASRCLGLCLFGLTSDR